MIITTTASVEGRKIIDYNGIVVDEAFIGLMEAQALVAISLEGPVG